MSVKSKTTKRSLVAAAGVAASMASLVVAASPASASYKPTCTGVPSKISREYGYLAKCSNFPISKKNGSAYIKVTKGSKTTTYVFGKFSSGHLGNANASFVVTENAPLGTQSLHFALDGVVVAVPVKITN
jgi:hypothetical protein